MFRRRAKGIDPSNESSASQDAAPEADDGQTTAVGAAEAASTASVQEKPERPHGPWDVSELDDRAAHTAPRLDLGGLRIRPKAGMKVQLQIDKSTGRASSVLLAAEQAAVQLMVIAAAKSTPLWPATRQALSADATSKGGTANEGRGPWGPVLRLALPAQAPDGTKGTQPTVVLGVDGPRWMLRATMIGRAAVDQDQMNQMMGILQDTVVVRGDDPMAPGEVISLTPPARQEGAVPAAEVSDVEGDAPVGGSDVPTSDAAADTDPAGAGDAAEPSAGSAP